MHANILQKTRIDSRVSEEQRAKIKIGMSRKEFEEEITDFCGIPCCTKNTNVYSVPAPGENEEPRMDVYFKGGYVESVVIRIPKEKTKDIRMTIDEHKNLVRIRCGRIWDGCDGRTAEVVCEHKHIKGENIYRINTEDGKMMCWSYDPVTGCDTVVISNRLRRRNITNRRNRRSAR